MEEAKRAFTWFIQVSKEHDSYTCRLILTQDHKKKVTVNDILKIKLSPVGMCPMLEAVDLIHHLKFL